MKENLAGRLVIDAVADSTAAAAAGLQTDDLIVAVGGSAVTGRDRLREILAQYNDGDLVEVTVIRGQTTSKIPLRIVARNDAEFPITPPGAETGILGMFLIKDAKNRIRVTKVAPASPAHEAGVRVDDQLLELSGHSVESLEEVGPAYRAGTEHRQNGKPDAIKIKLLRNGTPFEVSVAVPVDARPMMRPPESKVNAMVQQPAATPQAAATQAAAPPNPNGAGGGAIFDIHQGAAGTATQVAVAILQPLTPASTGFRSNTGSASPGSPRNPGTERQAAPLSPLTTNGPLGQSVGRIIFSNDTTGVSMQGRVDGLAPGRYWLTLFSYGNYSETLTQSAGPVPANGDAPEVAAPPTPTPQPVPFAGAPSQPQPAPGVAGAPGNRGAARPPAAAGQAGGANPRPTPSGRNANAAMAPTPGTAAQPGQTAAPTAGNAATASQTPASGLAVGNLGTINVDSNGSSVFQSHFPNVNVSMLLGRTVAVHPSLRTPGPNARPVAIGVVGVGDSNLLNAAAPRNAIQ